jgi:hypothetical protein
MRAAHKRKGRRALSRQGDEIIWHKSLVTVSLSISVLPLLLFSARVQTLEERESVRVANTGVQQEDVSAVALVEKAAWHGAASEAPWEN